MGFMMIAFVRIPKKWMLPIAAFVYIVPSGIIYGFTYYLNKLSPNAMMEGYADIHQIERSLEAYAYGSYGEIFSFRFFEWLTYGLTGSLLGVFVVLPLIMIGAGLSKWKVIERAGELKAGITIVTVVALAAGIWMKAAPHIGGPSPDAHYLANTIRWSCISDWLYRLATLTLSTAVSSARYSVLFQKQAGCR